MICYNPTTFIEKAVTLIPSLIFYHQASILTRDSVKHRNMAASRCNRSSFARYCYHCRAGVASQPSPSPPPAGATIIVP